jgi:hypothetical protein
VAIGPTAGGWLLAHYSWGSIFAVNLPVVALALIAGWFVVPASVAPERPRFDPAGTVLAVLASGALTYTIIEAQPSGWTSAATAGRGALSIVLLAAFVAGEAHVPHPMMPLRLFRDPSFAVASGAVAILFFGLAGVTFMLTQIYQFVLGYSPLAAGVRSLPSAVALTIAVPAGLGYLALATGRTTYPHYLIAATVMAVGTGLTTAPATQSVLSCLTPASFGVGSAVNNTTRNLGSVLGVAALGSLAATAYARGMAILPGVPRPAVAAARGSISAATQVTRQLRSGQLRSGQLRSGYATGAAHAVQAGSCPPSRRPGPGPPKGPRTGLSADDGDQVTFLDDVALGDVHLGEHTRALGQDRDLHLH